MTRRRVSVAAFVLSICTTCHYFLISVTATRTASWLSFRAADDEVFADTRVRNKFRVSVEEQDLKNDRKVVEMGIDEKENAFIRYDSFEHLFLEFVAYFNYIFLPLH